MVQFGENRVWNNNAFSPGGKFNSPLVKQLYLTNFENEVEQAEFKMEAMSEF